MDAYEMGRSDGYGWDLGGSESSTDVGDGETVVVPLVDLDLACAHSESVSTPDGHGAFCRLCGETLA